MPEKNPHTTSEALKARMKTLQLATLGEDNEPHCGYTPFIFDGPDLIVFISQLAVHTRDLLANSNVGVMLIDDEQDSNNLFARCRVRYQCNAIVIKPEEDAYTLLLDRYHERQGKVVSLIRQLPDFVLFRLRPKSGVLVMGFGDAYRIEGDNMDEFVHVSST